MGGFFILGTDMADKVDKVLEDSLVETIRELFSWSALVDAIKELKYGGRSELPRYASVEEAKELAESSNSATNSAWASALHAISATAQSGVPNKAGDGHEVQPSSPPSLETLKKELNARLRYIPNLTADERADLIMDFGLWFSENYEKILRSYRVSGNSPKRVSDPLLGKQKDAKVAVKLFPHEGSTYAGARKLPKGPEGEDAPSARTNAEERAVALANDKVWQQLTNALREGEPIEGMVIDLQADINAPAIQAGGIKGALHGGHFLVTSIGGIKVYDKPKGVDVLGDKDEVLRAAPYIFNYSSARTKLADGSLSTERHLPVGSIVKIEAPASHALAGASADHTEGVPKSLTFLLGQKDMAEEEKMVEPKEWGKFLEFSSRIFANKKKEEKRRTTYTEELSSGGEEDGEEGGSADDEFSTDVLDDAYTGYQEEKAGDYETRVREKFRKAPDAATLRKEKYELENPSRSLHKGISDRLNRFNRIVQGRKDTLESNLLGNVKEILGKQDSAERIAAKDAQEGKSLPEVMIGLMSSKDVMDQYVQQITDSVLSFARLEIPYGLAKAQEKFLASRYKGDVSELGKLSPQQITEVIQSFSQGMPDSRLYELVKGKAMASVSKSQFDQKVRPILNASLWSTMSDILSRTGEGNILDTLVDEVKVWGGRGSNILSLQNKLLAAKENPDAYQNPKASARDLVKLVASNKELASKMLDKLTKNLREIALTAVTKVDTSALDKMVEQEEKSVVQDAGSVSGQEGLTVEQAESQLSQAAKPASKIYKAAVSSMASETEIDAIRLASKKLFNRV